jgi:hypothetical protein
MTEQEIEQDRNRHYDLQSSIISVVFRKYVYTGKLSFSACLAENPGVLNIENPRFYARNAGRMTSHGPLGVAGSL